MAGEHDKGRAAVGRREQVLQMLRASREPRGIQGLAQELGVHVNTVRFHLDGLVSAGLVEQVAGGPSRPGRPPALFRATRRMDPAGPTNYRLLAAMLAGQLVASSTDPSAAAVQAGRSWAPRLLAGSAGGARARVGVAVAVRRMLEMLDDLGFEPERPAGPRPSTIRLRHCPFLDLVSTEPTGRVACSVHLGLMQGVLAGMGNPVTVDRLDPFVEPDLCVAHLGHARTAGPVRTGS